MIDRDCLRLAMAGGWRLAFILAALAVGAGRASAQTTHTIQVYNFDFGNAATGTHIDPVINVGDTVRWVWVDGLHSTTSITGMSESWDSGVQFGAFTYDHTFTNVGNFAYYCSLHGFQSGSQAVGMSGVVIVQPVPEPSHILLVAMAFGSFNVCYRRRARIGALLARRLRPAFSAVELLVVLAILGTLVGLLLPAVQKVRESASYTRCRNNLKQIGLAIQQHEVSHGYYPGPGTDSRQLSVLAQVLPYLELDNLHRSIDPKRPLFLPRGDYGALDPAQTGAARTVVSNFLCPSDGHPPLGTAYDMATLAGTNYVVNGGTGTGTYYDFRHPTDGVFWYGSKLRRGNLTDGISSTMFVSEALLGAGADAYHPDTVDRRRHWRTAACTASPAPDRPGTNPPLTDEMCMMEMPSMYWRGDRNVSWIGGPGHRTQFNTYLMPNDAMSDCGSFGLGRFKAASNHPGGVNMILGDGSVHFIKNHIDLDTWRALSTRGQTEVIPSYCGCK